jgi:hypothetical protein
MMTEFGPWLASYRKDHHVIRHSEELIPWGTSNLRPPEQLPLFPFGNIRSANRSNIRINEGLNQP